jgi:exopolysaccharide biosynthesis polyprenyl glycosylphosphotransferase
MRKYARKSNPWQLHIGERRALLLLGDLIMGLISLVIALLYWGSTVRFIAFDQEFLSTRVPFWFYLLPLIWLVLLIEMYDIHRAGDWRQTVRGVAFAALVGLILYTALYFYYVDPPTSLLPRRGVAAFILAVSVLTLLWRRIYIRIFTAPQFMRRVLLVGGGKTGEILLQIVNDLWSQPFFLTGIVDDDPQKYGIEIEGVKVVGTSERLLEVIDEYRVSDIIVAISGEMRGSMFQALLDAQEHGVEISRMPVVYEELLGRVPIRLLEADWILRSFVDQTRANGFFEIAKRMVDIAVGLVGSIINLLLLPFIGLAIFIDDGLPIFYSQTRSGRGGQPYKMLKFRTMRRDAEADGQPQWAKEDDKRATRVGLILRKTHIDEIPQFINVLRGEMSLVGPRAERPELVEHFQQHVPFYRARLLVKPGITGWAQINYGYASTIDETITKLEYDLYYIKHRTMILDMIIFLRTPSTILGLRGR